MFDQFVLAEQIEMEMIMQKFKGMKFACEMMDIIAKEFGGADPTVGACSNNGSNYMCFSLKEKDIGGISNWLAGIERGNDADMIRIWPTRQVFEYWVVAMPRKQLIENFIAHGCTLYNNRENRIVKWSADIKFDDFKTPAEAAEKVVTEFRNLVSLGEINDRLHSKIEKLVGIEFEKIVCPTKKQ